MVYIYWITTGALVLFLLVSAGSYIWHPGTITGVRELGFPDFFRVQLVVFKVAAALVIGLPYFTGNAKQWAYGFAGFFLDYGGRGSYRPRR